MWKQNQCHGAKAEALPVNGLEQSGAWPAVLRAWAPFMVDAFEATQEPAFAAAAAALEPGSMSGHGKALQLAALHWRPHHAQQFVARWEQPADR